MKNLFFVLPVAALALVFGGCSKKNNGPATTASVMLVNGCDGTTGIYTKVNGKNVGPSNIAFFGHSGYQTVTAGSAISINFYLVNNNTPLTAGSPALTASDHYTIFAGGLITGPAFVQTTDDLTAPASGNAKVRFVNLGSENFNESFYIGSQKLDSNIAYTQYSPFYEITATSGVNVLVQDPAHATNLAQRSSQAFGAGGIYTIMLTGTSTGAGTSALQLTVIKNN